MSAWGISELIRDTRQKTGLTTTDLANQIGIDPSSLSRLEEAKANVSIEMLSKVCRVLRIGMTERMDSGSWIYQREQIETRKAIAAESMLGPPRAPTPCTPISVGLLRASNAGSKPGMAMIRVKSRAGFC
jgi:transcriptional regulator with XRE-family HTH domain